MERLLHMLRRFLLHAMLVLHLVLRLVGCGDAAERVQQPQAEAGFATPASAAKI